MGKDFNKQIEEYIEKLSRDHLVSKEVLESYFYVQIEEMYINLDVAMDGVYFCAKNKEYMKELKKLNRKYSFYHN